MVIEVLGSFHVKLLCCYMGSEKCQLLLVENSNNYLCFFFGLNFLSSGIPHMVGLSVVTPGIKMFSLMTSRNLNQTDTRGSITKCFPLTLD